MKDVAPQFKIGMQEHSHEFLRLLINAMQRSSSSSDNTTNATDVVDDKDKDDDDKKKHMSMLFIPWHDRINSRMSKMQSHIKKI